MNSLDCQNWKSALSVRVINKHKRAIKMTGYREYTFRFMIKVFSYQIIFSGKTRPVASYYYIFYYFFNFTVRNVWCWFVINWVIFFYDLKIIVIHIELSLHCLKHSALPKVAQYRFSSIPKLCWLLFANALPMDLDSTHLFSAQTHNK